MIGMILVTHGRLAEEFVHAMEHVVGEQPDVATVCIGPNDDMEARRREIASAIKRVDTGAGAVILTDLFGGTPSNLAISLLKTGKTEVIAGINLPMLIRLAGDDFGLALLQQRDGQVRRRAAEQVGQDHRALARIDPFDRLSDFLAPRLHVIVRTDAHGGDGFLLADHMLHRVNEFLGQPAVGNQTPSDHVAG